MVFLIPQPPPPPVAVDKVDEVPSWRLAAADDADFEELAEDLLRLLRRHPPPTGTLRSAPPRVQYVAAAGLAEVAWLREAVIVEVAKLCVCRLAAGALEAGFWLRYLRHTGPF
jgi:hypothetical protein